MARISSHSCCGSPSPEGIAHDMVTLVTVFDHIMKPCGDDADMVTAKELHRSATRRGWTMKGVFPFFRNCPRCACDAASAAICIDL